MKNKNLIVVISSVLVIAVIVSAIGVALYAGIVALVPEDNGSETEAGIAEGTNGSGEPGNLANGNTTTGSTNASGNNGGNSNENAGGSNGSEQNVTTQPLRDEAEFSDTEIEGIEIPE